MKPGNQVVSSLRHTEQLRMCQPNRKTFFGTLAVQAGRNIVGAAIGSVPEIPQ